MGYYSYPRGLAIPVYDKSKRHDILRLSHFEKTNSKLRREYLFEQIINITKKQLENLSQNLIEI